MAQLSMTMRTRAGIVAVIALAIGLPLLAIVGRPGGPAPSPSGLPAPTGVAIVDASMSAAPSSRPIGTPVVSPTPSPTALADCEPPPSLPVAPVPVATPIVTQGSVAMAFTSFLYERYPDGSLLRRDVTGRTLAPWAIGLWLIPAGSATPRLLAATEDGVVLPLGLSGAGDRLAVWWLPARRGAGEATCLSGIYEVASDGSESHLLVQGDWTVDPNPDAAPPVVPTWTDPDQARLGGPRSYLLPRVSFSADGRFVALAADTDIRVLGVDEPQVMQEHVGSCPRTAWAPTGATFVAGCEQMTSAWLVRAGDGFTQQSIALPVPDLGIAPHGWEWVPADTIGLDGRNRVVVARFYGFATGCETPGCTIPSPAYSFTTIDPATGHLSSHGAKIPFIVTEPGTSLVSNASWVYAPVDVGQGPAGRTISATTGDIAKTSSLGTIVGASLDGQFLFGAMVDPDRMSVSSLVAAGSMHRVASVTWPDALISSSIDPVSWGLVVARS